MQRGKTTLRVISFIEKMKDASHDMIHVACYDGSGTLRDITDINNLNKQLESTRASMAPHDFLRFLRQKNVFLVVARDASHDPSGASPGTIVGKASLHIVELDDSTKKALVEQVVVDGAYRGAGIADKIDDMLCAIAKENNVAYIDLTSNPSRVAANKFYIRRGYVKRETNVYRKKIV